MIFQKKNLYFYLYFFLSCNKMLNKFIVTLIAMVAVLMALFSPEIKENYSDGTFPTTDSCFNSTCPGSKVNLGPWGGNGLQMTRVGDNAIARGHCKLNSPFFPNHQLGYDTRSTGEASLELNGGVGTLRNMQSKNPTRFMNTNSPKFASMDPAFRASAAVPLDRTSVSAAGGCGMPTVYSGFGQLQHSNNANDSIVEGFDGYEKNDIELPKDMCNVNLMGTDSQPVIYDRLMYSNIKSRLRGQGDYIRGDLLITPDNYKCNGGGHPGWFQVSVKPNRDLNMGAMAMIAPVGGRDEEIALGIAQGDCTVASFGI